MATGANGSMMWAICFIFPGQLSVAFVRIVGWLANFFFISNNLFYHFRVNFNGTKFFPDTVGWKAKLKVLNKKLEWKVCKLNLKTNNDPYTVLTNNCWGEFIFGIWNTIHFEHLNLNIKLLSLATTNEKKAKRRNDPIDPCAHKRTIAQGE